ncbi:MAG: hypothetical protein JWM28_1878, partial [Chitinophagaceae bacterium]|nr:hypothetical protein [Chitinophagaceae bacterium]
DIRVDAKTFHNIVLMKIKYSGAGYESNIENLQEVNELIQSLGGCLYISCNKTDETTLSFTFLSHCFSMSA